MRGAGGSCQFQWLVVSCKFSVKARSIDSFDCAGDEGKFSPMERRGEGLGVPTGIPSAAKAVLYRGNLRRA
jgi:hypothetical protein